MDADTPANRVAANKLFASGKLEPATEAFQKCIDECSPDDNKELSILKNNLGIVYKKRNMVKEAIVAFTESINLDETYFKPLFQRFNLLMVLGQLEMAKVDGEKILELDPQFMKGKF